MSATEKDITANLLMRRFLGIDDMYDDRESRQESISTENCTISVSNAVPETTNDCSYTSIYFEDTEAKLEK